MPRKWNTAVAGAKDNFLLHNDIAFHPVEQDGEMGFGVWVGGILSSQMNAYAIPLNAWVRPDEICRITDAVVFLGETTVNGINVLEVASASTWMHWELTSSRSKVETLFGPLTPIQVLFLPPRPVLITESIPRNRKDCRLQAFMSQWVA